MRDVSLLYSLDKNRFGLGDCFICRAEWNESMSQEFEASGATSLRLSSGAGWKGGDLEFVRTDRRLHELLAVEVFSYEVRDLSPLESIKTLQHVGLQCGPKARINVGRLRDLRYLLTTKPDTVVGLELMHDLELLQFSMFVLQPASYWQTFHSLRQLELRSTVDQNLDGLEVARSIQKVLLWNSPRMADLSSLSHLPQLHTVALDGLTRLGTVDHLARIVHLRDLRLDNCGTIESLQPLLRCEKLEFLSFIGNTTIADRKIRTLAQIAGLRGVRMAERRGYDCSRRELEELLAMAR